MSVGVDQSRHDGLARVVDEPRAGRGPGLVSGPDGDDLAIPDGDAGVLERRPTAAVDEPHMGEHNGARRAARSFQRQAAAPDPVLTASRSRRNIRTTNSLHSLLTRYSVRRDASHRRRRPPEKNTNPISHPTKRDFPRRFDTMSPRAPHEDRAFAAALSRISY